MVRFLLMWFWWMVSWISRCWVSIELGFVFSVCLILCLVLGKFCLVKCSCVRFS